MNLFVNRFTMIDINNTLDLLKLKFYNEWLYTSHLADEGESQLHSSLTKQIVPTYIEPLELKKDAFIVDVGCGAGYFLDEMKDRGFTNVVGTTLSERDAKLCTDKGHNVKIHDPSFLPQTDGFHDESTDFVFLRHTLQQSPYPIFSLTEYNRILRQFGKMYIEVPAPDCERKHEFISSNYSILGMVQWLALLDRTGFKVEKFNNLDFDVTVNNAEGEQVTLKEKYFAILVTKQRPLDIK